MLPEYLTADASEDALDVGGLTVHRRGLAVSLPNGAEILGAAAGPARTELVRADYELAERIATEEAFQAGPPRYDLLSDVGACVGEIERATLLAVSGVDSVRFARSNGVALHRDWTSACRAALAELVERDRVLAAWCGETRPEDADLAEPLYPEITTHAWRACVFPSRSAVGGDLVTVGVFGFPKDEAMPFALGYAARETKAAAVEAAAREALQILAFLWGEPLPESALGPPGPGLHLDHFQVAGSHRSVRAWLDEGHGRFARRPVEPSPFETVSPAFVDLTPAWLGGGFRVAKCVAPALLPLHFGASPLTAHLPESLRLHPIA